MPTPLGPFSLRALIHFSAMVLNAISQETSVNSPSFAYLPSFIRNKGLVKRSFPYIILVRKYPLIQFKPLLTGASGSPCVATALPSFTPKSTEQPVPQKRQATLSQRMPSSFFSAPAKATDGKVIPADTAAAATAWLLIKSRRVCFIVKMPLL